MSNIYKYSKADHYTLVAILALLVFGLSACKEDLDVPPADPLKFGGTPIDIDIPGGFPPMNVPADNPFTAEGIDLGRHLFWEQALSLDYSMSCGTCHTPNTSFTDPDAVSVGVDGIAGERNSMVLVNLAWANDFTWDGAKETLEEQMQEPVQNPIEMHLEWIEALERLEGMPIYQEKFLDAFGPSAITQENAAKALAQFVRTMISGNSKYDQYENDLTGQVQLTASEERGLLIFLGECGIPQSLAGGEFGGDCIHCHNTAGRQFTDYLYHNNGLDATFDDLGRGGVTGDPLDNGKFKTPTLRNIEYSAPYMHDGRFATLEEVIDHYNTGIVESETVDPFVTKCTDDAGEFSLQLTEQGKADLIAFLKTLSDPEFIANPAFSNPHQ